MSKQNEKKFVCRSCGSESRGKAGTCCGAKREEEKKYVCKSCSSESYGKAGTCCDAEREEKKEAGACLACSCPCDKHKEHTHK